MSTTKKYSQSGFIVIIFLPAILISGIGIYKTGDFTSTESIILAFSCLTLLACMLVFYKLTILIDERSISFKFGIGWFGKKYKFTEIESCEIVSNNILHGIGIRWIGTGWLYNVSAGKAIELRFKNKKSVVRIGTDKPREICELVRERLSEAKK